MGPTPRQLRRRGLLDRLGWYETRDDDAVLTSSRQVGPTMPALVGGGDRDYCGPIIGMDDETGQAIGSDPFSLYRLGMLESVNVLIVGDVGVGKSTLVKHHYGMNQLATGARLCCFDRKFQKRSTTGRDVAGDGEYGRLAEVARRSGLTVTQVVFSRTGGARINLLDPQISAQSSDGDDQTVGQDQLLAMVAEMAHGPLETLERHCLNAAHRKALITAAAEGRVPVLGDVVEALYTLDESAIPHENLAQAGIVDTTDLLSWALKLAIDLERFITTDLSGFIDGETQGADGQPLDLSASDFLLVDTSGLVEGSHELAIVMAIMTTFVSSVWAADPRPSIVVLEEGYSADLPTVGAVFYGLAKRGRGIGMSLILVIHHLADIPDSSKLRALVNEAGIVHVFRQHVASHATESVVAFNLPIDTGDLSRLPKGTHVLKEGTVRPVRRITHTRTELSRWVTWTDDALAGGSAGPPNPFTQPDTTATGFVAAEEEGLR
ncbi:hypothetical protein [Enemella sp. A6]|uniref:hypothetical protein n=1 Tax=Enemella sp. A6 TaxID=3440152 RepID=UPI003EBD13EE